jgi:hypothetical protein
MSQVETRYWYCHPPSDLTDPRYVEVLVDYARRTPEAVVVYAISYSLDSAVGNVLSGQSLAEHPLANLHCFTNIIPQ